MYVTILHRKISTTLLAVFLMVFSVMITVLFIVIFRVEDKVISIINFNETTVKVDVRGTEYTIKPFDTQVLTFNTSNPIEIIVTDETNAKLQDIQVSGITRNAQLISVALNSSKGYCFFRSQVSINDSNNLVLQNKLDLNTSPQNYAISSIDTILNEYVYPGNSIAATSNTFTKPINYIYPISCNLIDSNDNVLGTIKAFSDYSAADQLKYLQDTRNNLNNAQDIGTLNTAIPTAIDKYYVSADKYVFVNE